MAGEFNPAALAMMSYQTAPGLSTDPDIMSDQGKLLTQLGKFGNATTDLDTLTMLGGIQPGAYAPMTTFDPVDAPGYRLLQSYKQGTPYQQYVAKQREVGKKNALEIYTDLQKLVANPGDDPFAHDVINSMPKQMVEQFTGTGNNRVSTGWQQIDAPDLKAVQDDLQKLESTILSDPEYTVGPDGQPVSATTEDSAAMKAWHDAGYVSDPTATYDPWSLAPAGTQERDKALTTSFAKALMGEGTAGVERKRADTGLHETSAALKRYQEQAGRDMTAQEPTVAGLQTPAGEQRRGGIAGILDLLPGDSGIADWMNRDRGPDTSRDKIPQRGGVADDLARVAEHPGKSVFGFLGEIPGKLSKIPGAVDRWTEDRAASADTAVGNPAEGFLSGNIGISNDESYMNDDTNTFRIPDWITGNKPDVPAAGQNPMIQSMLAKALGRAPDPGRTIAGGGGGGAARPARPAPAAFDRNTLNDVLTASAIAEYQKKLAAAQGKSHDALANQRKAAATSRSASHAYAQAQQGQAMRQAYVNQLASMGRTPGQDEVNARRRLILGG